MFRHGIEDLRALFEGDVRFTTPSGPEVCEGAGLLDP